MTALSPVLDRLAEKHLVHWLDGEVRTVSLARPPEQVTADELIQIGYQLVDASGLGQRSSLVERLRAAQQQLAERTTLASLVAALERKSEPEMRGSPIDPAGPLTEP